MRPSLARRVGVSFGRERYKSQWFYALARLNQHKYVVSYAGKEVQRFPFVPFSDRDDPLQPYTKFFNQLYQDCLSGRLH